MENFSYYSNPNESSKYINKTQNNLPIYTSSFSCQSNWSYLSNSSGFGSQTETLDFDFDSSNPNDNHYLNQSLPAQNGQAFYVGGGSTHSLDSLMESDVFTSDHHNPFFNTTNSLESILANNYCLKDVNIEEQNKIDDVHMWQFLLELLEDKHCRNLIRWISFDKNNHDNEFVIYDPIEIVRRWGVRHAKPNMSYKKFCRTLRYYYKKKILQKTAGKQHTYHFQINIQPYLNQLHYQQQQLNQQNQQQQQNFYLNNISNQAGLF